MRKVTSGSHTIDYVLSGGFSTGHVTEICGESASGKTQICLQTCLTCQLPPKYGGLFCSSIYFHTDGPFPVSRLHQMSNHTRTIYDIGEDPLDLVQVRKVHSLEELVCCIDQLHKVIPESYNECHPIGVVVVDSVASLCRFRFSSLVKDLAERLTILRRLIQKLKEIARAYKTTIIITNQVSDASNTQGPYVVESTGRMVQACLGTSWSQQIGTRVWLAIKIEGGTRKRQVMKQILDNLQPMFATFAICDVGVV